MYKIEVTDYGFHLTFGGLIRKEEMKRWATEFIEVISQKKGDFTVFVDLRTMEILPSESQPELERGQSFAFEHGMTRSAVTVSNTITRVQFKKIAQLTKIIDNERYIDVSATPNWEKAGMDWLLHGIEPE